MTTHESEFEQRLAEYLGDELTPEERAAFEARLAADPAAAEQVRALEGARAALERLVPEDEAAARAAAGLVLPGREFAAELGLRVPTAKTHSVRALAAIRGKLAGEAGEVQA